MASSVSPSATDMSGSLNALLVARKSSVFASQMTWSG